VTSQYISIGIAQAETGLSRPGWKQFVTETSLKVFRVPGNGLVVERTELDAAIHQAREVIRPDEIPARDLPL